MLGWTIKIIIFSVLLIFLVHHLICFFKNTLTIPKIKDLVKSSNKKYDDIYSVMNANNYNNNNNNNNNNNQYINYQPEAVDGSYINDLPTISMKDELKNFLKDQLVPNLDE